MLASNAQMLADLASDIINSLTPEHEVKVRPGYSIQVCNSDIATSAIYGIYSLDNINTNSEQ